MTTSTSYLGEDMANLERCFVEFVRADVASAGDAWPVPYNLGSAGGAASTNGARAPYDVSSIVQAAARVVDSITSGSGPSARKKRRTN
jgi:hypothetical protein